MKKDEGRQRMKMGEKERLRLMKLPFSLPRNFKYCLFNIVQASNYIKIINTIK